MALKSDLLKKEFVSLLNENNFVIFSRKELMLYLFTDVGGVTRKGSL